MAIQNPVRPDGVLEFAPPNEKPIVLFDEDRQPGKSPLPSFLREEPGLSNPVIRRVARIIDADIKRERHLPLYQRGLLAFLAPRIRRRWQTKVVEAYRIWEVLGRAMPDSNPIVVDTDLVQRLMPVTHRGVQEYLMSIDQQAEGDGVQTVYLGCHWEVQAAMTIQLVRAYGCPYIVGNLNI